MHFDLDLFEVVDLGQHPEGKGHKKIEFER